MYAFTEASACRARSVSCGDCDIRAVSICDALHEDELQDLALLAQDKHYASRTTLFSQGEHGEHVFNIKTGVVRLCRLLADGRRQILDFVLPGDFIGLTLMDRYEFTAETIGEVDACKFDRESFIGFIETKPHLMRSLHRATARELALGRDQMVLLGRRTAEEKIAAFLLGLRRRYQRVTTCEVTLPLPMTRQDIADYCGLTLETVSRTFSKLAREKIILIVPDGVRLVMLDRLSTLVA